MIKVLRGVLMVQGGKGKPITVAEAENMEGAIQTILGLRESVGLDIVPKVLNDHEAFIHVKLPFEQKFTYVFMV